MKKPENFNAGATVKREDPLAAAISNNFSTQRTPVETVPVQQTPQTVFQPAPVIEQESVSKKEPKEKFLVSMSKGERSVFKAFCATKNVSMNHFVMCAMDYFKEDLENGKVTISPHSYKRQD